MSLLVKSTHLIVSLELTTEGVPVSDVVVDAVVPVLQHVADNPAIGVIQGR